jgi:hypothetical protein
MITTEAMVAEAPKARSMKTNNDLKDIGGPGGGGQAIGPRPPLLL